MNERIRCILIGDFSFPPDEGMKKSAASLGKHLTKYADLKKLDVSRILSVRQFVEAFRFRPDIIHYLHGPTPVSLVLAKALGLALRARVFVTASHPRMPRMSPLVQRLLRIDTMITQRADDCVRLSKFAIRSQVVPNGVELDEFKPVDHLRKARLRRSHGIGEEEFVILHVGPIVASRNLDWLANSSRLADRIVVIGSTTTKLENDVMRRLRERGFTVIHEYVPRIWEFYQLSDCYVFTPLDESASIAFPLSVFEALACGIPVVCTKHGALGEFLADGNGVVFVENYEGFLRAIESVKSTSSRVSPQSIRSHAAEFSWDKAARRIADLYEISVNAR